MPVQKVKSFLDNNHVQYETLSHPPAFTAQEIAATAHVSGRELAKTVMVRIDGRMAMAVLPASSRIDLDRLRVAVAADSVELATEDEFEDLFPNCDLGAMPPFGNLYGMDVFVEAHLAEDEQIAFSAGSHTELVQLAYDDYARLVKPQLCRFSMEPAGV